MIAKHRDLRTGRTIWKGRRAVQVAGGRLSQNVKTDVLVVGAGITGAMIAQSLAAEGVGVMVVDRRGVALGSSVASTALVQYEIDTPLTVLTRKIGAERAARAWRRSLLAVQALGGTLRTLGVDDVAARDTLYLAGNVLDPAGLRREAAARRSIGLETNYIGAAALARDFGLKAAGALRSFGGLAIDPRKAALALLADAQANGAKIFAPEEVVEVTAHPRSVSAQTQDGHTITARHLVFATGYELPKYVPKRGHQIISTWAIATAPQRGKLWRDEVMIWEAADPYLYVRTTVEGRVICGGEDEEFSDDEKRDKLIARKTATLSRKLKRLIPALDTSAEFAWAGSFGQSRTGLPTIGEIPAMPNCWAALGYGGNGTTYSRIAAEVIRGALAGRPDADADLYDFSRP